MKRSKLKKKLGSEKKRFEGERERERVGIYFFCEVERDVEGVKEEVEDT